MMVLKDLESPNLVSAVPGALKKKVLVVLVVVVAP